jgi:hypothetical protein
MAGWRDEPGWGSLMAWALAFALVALSMLGIFSIGIFILPFAVLALSYAFHRRRARWEPLLGGTLGVGAMILLIGLMNLGATPCGDGPSVSVVYPGQTHLDSCGGREPAPFLLVGGLLVAIPLGAYRRSTRRSESILPARP